MQKSFQRPHGISYFAAPNSELWAILFAQVVLFHQLDFIQVFLHYLRKYWVATEITFN